jgi:hypothetical protein
MCWDTPPLHLSEVFMLWYFIKHTDNFNFNLTYNELIKFYTTRQEMYV